MSWESDSSRADGAWSSAYTSATTARNYSRFLRYRPAASVASGVDFSLQISEVTPFVLTISAPLLLSLDTQL